MGVRGLKGIWLGGSCHGKVWNNLSCVLAWRKLPSTLIGENSQKFTLPHGPMSFGAGRVSGRVKGKNNNIQEPSNNLPSPATQWAAKFGGSETVNYRTRVQLRFCGPEWYTDRKTNNLSHAKACIFWRLRGLKQIDNNHNWGGTVLPLHCKRQFG